MDALNLYAYIEMALHNIIAMTQNTQATIYNEIDEDVYVKGIPAYLDSIILNFLTNAIKYRSKKRAPIIELKSEIEDDYVVFKIKDNGLGMDMEKYGKNIFEMYKTFHFNEDAIGIGLFITKNHIESLGGKVTVTSEVDVGTTFLVYLKRAYKN